MGILLNCHKINKSFGGKTLFKELSLGVNEGDRIGLIGPNGAGKSTLLRIMAKQLEPDSGALTVQRGTKVGILEQTPRFKENATLLETILEKSKDYNDDLSKAYEWMALLDLHRFGDQFLVEHLAGGWQKRVALARELILEPHLLLLDEPTNHLDVSSILWLEEFLENASFAYLMITHDRLFLQRTVDKIIDLDPRNPNFIFQFSGTYADFLENKNNLLAGETARQEVVKNILGREVAWLRRGAKARQTKQKARIERASEIKEQYSEIRERNRDRNLNLEFADVSKGPQRLIVAEKISKKIGDNEIFTDFSCIVSPNTRLAILGENGIGKSTLIRVLIGEESPSSGAVKIADGIKIAYFDQKRDLLNYKLSLLKNICPEGDYVNCQGQFIFARSYLERFQFKVEQMDLPVERLSGGEQSRLRLAQIMLVNCQVLILDEPTNDLDLKTLETLENALNEYKGAVVLVTHDRYFMDRVADQIMAMDRVGEKTICQFFAEYSQWENWLIQEKAQQEAFAITNREKLSNDNKSVSDSSKKVMKDGPKKMSFKEKQELKTIESAIFDLEEKVVTLQKELESESVSKDHLRIKEIYESIQKLQDEIEAKYNRWSELDLLKQSVGEE